MAKSQQSSGMQLFDVVVCKGSKVVRVAYERLPWYVLDYRVRTCKLRKGERCEVREVENVDDYDIEFTQDGQTFTLRCRGVKYGAGLCFVESLKEAGMKAKLSSVHPAAALQSA